MRTSANQASATPAPDAGDTRELIERKMRLALSRGLAEAYRERVTPSAADPLPERLRSLIEQLEERDGAKTKP